MGNGGKLPDTAHATCGIASSKNNNNTIPKSRHITLDRCIGLDIFVIVQESITPKSKMAHAVAIENRYLFKYLKWLDDFVLPSQELLLFRCNYACNIAISKNQENMQRRLKPALLLWSGTLKIYIL